MLTLRNFESQIGAPILQRGESYYKSGSVTSLELIGEDIWNAEVEGSDDYDVEITLKGNKISNYSCNCPYDAGICKHIVAVLFCLKDENKTEEKKKEGNSKIAVFETLLVSLTKTDFQNFIRSHAGVNKEFKAVFELYFAEKDGRIDVEKKYAELVKNVIKKYSNRGFVDYKSSFGLSKELDVISDKGFDYIKKNNFRDAFSLVRAVLKPMMNTIENCDDSSGSLGDSIDYVIKLLENIILDKKVAVNIKEEIFDFLKKELNDKTYFDYGNFGSDMFCLFQNLAVQLNNGPAFIAFIDAHILKLKSEYDSYWKEYFQKSKIEFYRQTGKTIEAENLVHQNMDIVDIRMQVLNNAIGIKNYPLAKKIIAEGIKIAKSKAHTGTVEKWEKELLRIAYLEKDLILIRSYTKHFAFNRGFSIEYYQQWKKTFKKEEWKPIIENYISETINKLTVEWNKNKFWKQPYPPLLDSLAPVYIAEKYIDRLLILVQQANNLNSIQQYHEILLKSYPKELLALYLPALEVYGINANERSQYADLVRKMQMVMKDIPDGKDQIVNLAKKLKARFSSTPRRPAMIDELNKIL